MDFSITKRTLIRIVSFTLAVILVLSIFAFTSMKQSESARRSLEYHYLKSVDDLITHTQNINSDLTKAMYAKSPALLSQMSSKIWREAGFAKDIISTLPIEYTKLQNTNKLLSQVGDYCVSLSKSFANGTPITNEQRNTLMELNKYCDTMTREAIIVGDGLRTGSLSLEKVKKAEQEGMNDEGQTSNIGDGFTEFEEGFTAYPTLIYDGPFSDHIMQKEPERLKGEQNCDRETARKKASLASGIPEASLKDGEDEKSKMESYGFYADGVNISITKKGGLISSMLKSRMVEKSTLTADDAIEYARKYLLNLGVKDMQSTYYEIANNVITINFAYKQGDVLMYTDLIKVSVALDNGEITGFDSRGYIVNHKLREISPANLEQATKSVSDYLTIVSSQLCVIPTGGLNEVLCYEFKCKSEDEKDILVYVNVATLAEEHILILLIDENGTLTI